jgi:hypothetical protein
MKVSFYNFFFFSPETKCCNPESYAHNCEIVDSNLEEDVQPNNICILFRD